MMLEEILDYLHNYFVVPGGVHSGNYTISSGTVNLDFMQEGQYFRIVGSVFNDGVHQYPVYNLKDEVFTGAVWALAVPPYVVALSHEIESWCNSNQPTNIVSEAFGGYSRTLATDGRTGAPATWQNVFRGRLSAWRKLP